MNYPANERIVSTSYSGGRILVGDCLKGAGKTKQAVVGVQFDRGPLVVMEVFEFAPLEAERFAHYLRKRAAAARAYNRKKK